MARKSAATKKATDATPDKKAGANAAAPQAMLVDARVGVGMFFTLTGTVLGALGLATRDNPGANAKSLGIDANLWSGLALLAFGIVVLTLGRRGQAKMDRSQAAAIAKPESRRLR
jgi:hypothetical protein